MFVDIDAIPYPAGAIYELSAVCEVGTIVIALGSDDTARFSREILLAGVSDYLVKPITAAAVRESAARAVGSAANAPLEGWLVGFAGTGGSGATTLAAATALLAAKRGRYVSVLDLNRTCPALAFALDVEPAGGLVDLLSTTARASLHPEMVDGMHAERSSRIAVYGYPWSAIPPPLAPVWAVGELLVELQRRSHLVIVDGMDDPATRQTLLAMRAWGRSSPCSRTPTSPTSSSTACPPPTWSAAAGSSRPTSASATPSTWCTSPSASPDASGGASTSRAPWSMPASPTARGSTSSSPRSSSTGPRSPSAAS